MIKPILKHLTFTYQQDNHKNLLRLATLFLFVVSITLTLAPTAQARQIEFNLLTWEHWIGFIIWVILFSYFASTYNAQADHKDSLLLPLIAIMSGWGLLTVWRLSTNLGIRQTIWFSLSLVIISFGLPYKDKIIQTLRRQKYLWLFAGLILTSLTFIFGTNPTNYGPNLWLGCCGVYLQPAEPLKLLLILYLAAYFADRQPFSTKLLALIIPTAFMAGITLLILVFQRDLGTASIFIFIYAGMVYTAVGKKRMLLASLLTLSLAALIGYRLFDVVQLRIDAWLNPWNDPTGRSYQIVQSLISIAAGGMTGRGPGMGYPNLVPIAFSDFIFTAIAEEYGFPGTLALILIFIIFTFRGLSIALRAQDRYQRYLAAGLTLYIASQAILIIGGNTRLLPLTGVTLPFFSYGGSSLLTSFIAFFLLISVDHNSTDNIKIQGKSTAIVHFALILLIGFLSLLLINSWWSIYRGPTLVTRTDNARRTISDLYNKRGYILDRDLEPLSITEGKPGEYIRYYTYPEFTNIIGYTHPFYGQAGIEASFDPILRGLENQSPWDFWYFHLLYGQSPPGLDIQLTLDRQLQLLAAQFLHNTPGAIALVNSENGEILVLYSFPYFDANTLELSWASLQSDPSGPLINRATQTLYPPGPSLAPFLIAETSSTGILPAQITNLNSSIGTNEFYCAVTITLPTNWSTAGKYGCPAPLEYLGKNLGAEGLESLFSRLGFYETPKFRLELAAPFIPTGITNPSLTGFGQSDVFTTPLQMALAASTINNGGNRPYPKLHLATQDNNGDWTLNDQETKPVNVFSVLAANQTAKILTNESLPIWESIAFAQTITGNSLTWYLGGTLPGQESSYSIAIVLEREDAKLVQTIGQRLLTEVLKP